MALGLPWIIGPLMGGVAAVAIWLLGTRLYDERTGRLAGALALISPFFWYISGSYQSHSACLAMGCLAALGLLTSIQEAGRRSLLAAFGGGAALGAAALNRPLTAVGLALGLGLLALIATPAVTGSGRQIRRMAVILTLFAVCAAAVAALV
ncbi:glycosyltransferase family 39 protein, partial [Thermodesulfobacteriota bacterium]